MTNNQITYLWYEILINLQDLCGLSQQEVSTLIKNTDLLEFIKVSYELYHTQSIYTILEDLAEHLKEKYGIVKVFKLLK